MYHFDLVHLILQSHDVGGVSSNKEETETQQSFVAFAINGLLHRARAVCKRHVLCKVICYTTSYNIR